MTLAELIVKVKEQDLSKEMLEHYHSELCNLKAQLKQEMATLKKEEALYLLNRESGESVASRKISWGASQSGQRKFDIEGYLGSVTALLSGVKTRIFALL